MYVLEQSSSTSQCWFGLLPASTGSFVEMPSKSSEEEFSAAIVKGMVRNELRCPLLDGTEVAGLTIAIFLGQRSWQGSETELSGQSTDGLAVGELENIGRLPRRASHAHGAVICERRGVDTKCRTAGSLPNRACRTMP